MLNLEDTIKRVDRAKSNKRNWENILRECYDYISPERQTIDEFSKGQMKRTKAFDSTAIEGLESYASRLQSQLVPAWKTWAVLKAGSEIPEENHDEANEWLEKATNVLFDHIHHSNFNTQIHEAFLDLGISTGCIVVEEGNSPHSSLHFRSITLSDIIIERTNTGIVKNVWREFKIPVSDITQIWRKAKLSDQLNQMLREEPSKEIVITEGVMYMPEEDNFCTMVYCEQTKDVLIEDYTLTSPYVVFRESVTSGESYGRGRGIRMLPDIKTLNKMVEFNLRVGAIRAGGIFTAVNDGVINPYSLNIQPNTIIPVSSNSTENPTLRALDAGGDFTPSETRLRELQDTIRKGFMGQPFGQVDETPVRSATEMSMRNVEHQQTYMSAFGRLQTELLEQLLARCVDILVQAGKLEPLEIDGKVVTVKFTSPLARAQDAEELNNIMQGIQYISAIESPDAVNRAYKIEDVPEYIGDLVGIPSRFKRTEEEKKALDEVNKKRQLAPQQMMQQEQQEGMPNVQ